MSTPLPLETTTDVAPSVTTTDAAPEAELLPAASTATPPGTPGAPPGTVASIGTDAGWILSALSPPFRSCIPNHPTPPITNNPNAAATAKIAGLGLDFGFSSSTDSFAESPCNSSSLEASTPSPSLTSSMICTGSSAKADSDAQGSTLSSSSRFFEADTVSRSS